jgi:hypothetical protein
VGAVLQAAVARHRRQGLDGRDGGGGGGRGRRFFRPRVAVVVFVFRCLGHARGRAVLPIQAATQ